MSSLEPAPPARRPDPPPPRRTAKPQDPAPGGAPRAELPSFPLPARLPNGRLYNWLYELDCFEAELRAYALGAEPVYPPRPDRDVLVPTNDVGRRYGVGRRTVGRWVKAAEDAARKETTAAQK